MARAISLERYLGALSVDQRAQVDAVRALVRNADAALVEGMKWNAPSWALHGIDRITLNTMNKEHRVKLVLHMGVERREDRSAPPVMNDPSGLVAWSSNIRGVLTFADLDDVQAKAAPVRGVLERWLATPV